VHAFKNAGPWGRLLTAGFLLKKMGGLGAFAKIGTRAGATMGASMATATARSGGWKGAAVGIGRSIGGPLALAAAVAFGPEFIKKVQEDVSTTTIVGDKVKFKLPKDITLPLEPGFLKGFAKKFLGVIEPAKQEMRNFGETAEGVFRKVNGQNTKEAVAS
jgi:hypothetical protein